MDNAGVTEFADSIHQFRRLTIRLSKADIKPGVGFPHVTIHLVELESKPAAGPIIPQRVNSWPESFATEAELKAFLRGVQAGASMVADRHINLPVGYSE